MLFYFFTAYLPLKMRRFKRFIGSFVSLFIISQAKSTELRSSQFTNQCWSHICAVATSLVYSSTTAAKAVKQTDGSLLTEACRLNNAINFIARTATFCPYLYSSIGYWLISLKMLRLIPESDTCLCQLLLLLSSGDDDNVVAVSGDYSRQCG